LLKARLNSPEISLHNPSCFASFFCFPEEFHDALAPFFSTPQKRVLKIHVLFMIYS